MLTEYGPSLDREFLVVYGCNMLVVPYSDGLGFDCKGEDYKFRRFIKIYYEDNHDHHDRSIVSQVTVYSLTNDSWKDISSDHEEYYNICDARSTYVNGRRLYWIAREFIVSFDLADEKFSTLPLPDVGTKEINLDLVELDGSLGVVIYTTLGVEKLFVFCVLEEEGGRIPWTRKINYDFCPSDVEKPLGFCRNNELFLLQGFDSV